MNSLSDLEEMLVELDLTGLVIRGPGEVIWLGRRQDSKMASAIKVAMDPAGKFPDFVDQTSFPSRPRGNGPSDAR